MDKDNMEKPAESPLNDHQLEEMAGGIGIGELQGTTTTTNTGHDQWIDVLSVDWGTHKPGGGATRG